MDKVTLALSLPPSVNAMYRHAMIGEKGHQRPTDILTDEAKAWFDETVLRVKLVCGRHRWHTPPAGVKVVCELYALWPDARRRDMSNLHKIIPDALEKGGVVENDCYLLVRDMDYGVDRTNPRLLVAWYRLNAPMKKGAA